MIAAQTIIYVYKIVLLPFLPLQYY